MDAFVYVYIFLILWPERVQPVERVAAGWTTGEDSRQRRNCLLLHHVHTGCRTPWGSYPIRTLGSFRSVDFNIHLHLMSRLMCGALFSLSLTSFVVYLGTDATLPLRFVVCEGMIEICSVIWAWNILILYRNIGRLYKIMQIYFW
jgi:hypothetical protein